MVKSMPKPNPDDRSDNVEKIRNAVQDTIENLEDSEDMLEYEDLPEEQREEITEKNERREESIEGLRAEIRDEARNRRQHKY